MSYVKNVLWVIKGVVRRKKWLAVGYLGSLMGKYVGRGGWEYPEGIVVEGVYPMKEYAGKLRENGVDTLGGLIRGLEEGSIGRMCCQGRTFDEYVLKHIRTLQNISVSSTWANPPVPPPLLPPP